MKRNEVSCLWSERSPHATPQCQGFVAATRAAHTQMRKDSSCEGLASLGLASSRPSLPHASHAFVYHSPVLFVSSVAPHAHGQAIAEQSFKR